MDIVPDITSVSSSSSSCQALLERLRDLGFGSLEEYQLLRERRGRPETMPKTWKLWEEHPGNCRKTTFLETRFYPFFGRITIIHVNVNRCDSGVVSKKLQLSNLGRCVFL